MTADNPLPVQLSATPTIDIGDVTVINAAGNAVYIRPGTGVNLNTNSVIITTLPATPAGENHIGAVGGHTVPVGVDFTRPNNTTPYAALQVVGTSPAANMSFANIARVAAGSGYITKVRVMTDKNDITPRLRLHLFHTAPTAIADGSNYTLLYTNRANRVGYIDLPAMNTEGTGSDASNSINVSTRLAFQCANGSQILYGILETLDAFTPAANENWFVEITAEQN